MAEAKTKKIVKKAEVKTAAKAPKAEAVKREKTVKPVQEKKEGTLTVALYDVTGKEAGTVTLPETVFGAKVNPVLMAQAVRVYLANQRLGTADTQTRGEVDGSTRKIYRQKGTGRARHGGIRAPIFVGGGVAHGPKSKDYELSLPKKMRKAALLSALSQMVKDGNVKVVAGLEKVEPKTKTVAAALEKMGLDNKKTLLVMPKHVENVFKAARNIKRVSVAPVQTLNTYEVLNGGTLVFMQEAVDAMVKEK